MKSKHLLIFAMIAGLLLLLACSPTTKKESIEISCEDFAKSPHISLSRVVEVNVNDSLSVTLCSNPTTGFEWESAVIADQTVLEEVDHKFVPPEGSVTGTAGKDVWTFKALKEGTSIISMEYSRPWEGGEKGEWTFSLTTVVK